MTNGNDAVAMVDAEGNFSENWRDGLDEGIRDHDELKNAKNLKDLAKTHVNLQSRLGKSIQIPGDDVSDEDRAVAMGDIYTKLGRPEAPAGYEVTRPQLPDGMEYDVGVENEARELAHKAGLNQAQFKELYDWFNKTQIGKHTTAMKSLDGMVENAEKKLREEWPDDKTYNAGLEMARRAYDMYGGEAFVQFMVSMGLNNNPIVVKTFYDIYRQHHADEFVDGMPPGVGKTTQRAGVLSYKKTHQQERERGER